MSKAIQISQIVLALMLIITVLLQQRGSSLGVAFGASNAAYRSRRGIEQLLFIATIVIGIAFTLVSVGMIVWGE